jgi:hypothetical protein
MKQVPMKAVVMRALKDLKQKVATRAAKSRALKLLHRQVLRALRPHLVAAAAQVAVDRILIRTSLLACIIK